MATPDGAEADDVVVPTREQACILRLFCERGHMGWLGDVRSYRILMQKLHDAIQDIQREAVLGAHTSLEDLHAAGRGTDVLVQELQHAHKRIADLQKQLQHHARTAPPSPVGRGRQLATEDTEEFQREQAVVLGLQRRLSEAQTVAAEELRSAVKVNAELQDKVQQLEERVLAASIAAAESQVAHGKEVALLERKLEEAAALSAEKTRLLLQAEEHIKGLHVQMEEVRHVAERRAEEAAADREREALTKLTEELALLQLKFAKQQIRHGELEAKYKSQLTEAQSRLSEAQQQLERKGQELWEAASSCTELRQEMEALRRQGQKNHLELELELERQKRYQSPLRAPPAESAATSHPSMPTAASKLAAAAAELLKRLDSNASASTTASPGDSHVRASTELGTWHRRAGTVLSTVESTARRLLELCGQAHTESSQQEVVDLLLQLMEQTKAIIVTMHSALDSATGAELLLRAVQAQVEQLSSDAGRASMLQLHLQHLQEERDELRRVVDEKQQELAERQELLNNRSVDHETAARQVASLRTALREAEDRLARQDSAHQQQLDEVQGQVQAHMDAMAGAYREELEAIRAQLCGLSPATRSYAASPQYSPGRRPQSMASPCGDGNSFYHRLQNELELQPVHAMQQQLEQMMHENEQLRALHASSKSAESAELLQQAYTQLSKLQHKYKSLKQSYVKQTLRQHAINQSILHRAGTPDNEKENDAFTTLQASGRPHDSPIASRNLLHATSQANSRTPRHEGTPERDRKASTSSRAQCKEMRSATHSRVDAASGVKHHELYNTPQASRAANGIRATSRGRQAEKQSGSSGKAPNRRAQSSLSPMQFRQ